MSSSNSVRQSSLAQLPPPKSAAAKEAESSPGKDSKRAAASTSGGAAAGSVPGSVASDETLDSKIDRLIAARVEALLGKKLATAGAIAALPAPSTKPKVPANALVGHGMLTELRDNVGVGLGKVKRTQTKEDEPDEDDEEDGAVDGFADSDPVAATDSSDSKVKRLAPEILERIDVYGSAKSWVKMYDWKISRNRREAEAIAQAVDALRAEGLPVSSTGLEILLRRLSGIQLADLTGKWEACESVAWCSSGNSLLPRAELRRVLKDADQMSRLTAVSSSVTPKRAYNNRDQPAVSSANKPKGQWAKKTSSGVSNGSSKTESSAPTSSKKSASE
jgi:hypothetical protein